MNNLKENKPTADILMISMRAMGYSFESAIADIIDNSISASAHNIFLKFPIDPMDCYIAICDDGYGMTKEELFDAMKYGSEQKRGQRASDDLGRFGLGLKAASLSQCRKLTVASKKDGEISAYIWDLDVIEDKKDWYMIECSSHDISGIKQISWLDNVESGTIVVWENFDLIEKSSGNVYSELNKYKDSTADYLSLIFHRYLNKISGPMLDHIDLHVEVPPVDYSALSSNDREETSAEIRERVNKARKIQTERYKGTGITCNARLTPAMLKKYCILTDDAKKYLELSFERLGMSARAYDRILKVARTIADIDSSEIIDTPHILQAIQLRSLDRKYWGNN